MEITNTKYTLMNADIEILDVPKPSDTLTTVLASKKDVKDSDLMYLKFRFAHEGSNANNDVFEIEDLEDRHMTAIYKPLNIEHDAKKIIGTIYDTEFIKREDSENSKGAINIFAVMYKKLFPAVAKEMKKKYKEGKLNCSMETWYDKAKCSVCGGQFEDEKDYCEHLQERYTSSVNKRILKGITFGGCGIVDNPADKDASALALASKVDFEDKIDAGELKDKTEKQVEINRFNTIIREAENLYYSIIYGYGVDKDGEIVDKKKKLSSLISELKSLLDTVNINKIVKGEVNTMNSNIMEMKPEQLADAFMAKAIMENKESFTKDLAEKLEEVKADYEAKIAEATTNADVKINALKADKEAIEKEYNAYKLNVEKANLVATRKAALAQSKIDVSFEDDETLCSMTDKVFELFIKANAVKAPVAVPKVPVTDVPENQSAVATIVDVDATKSKEAVGKTLENILSKL